jgi:predicted Zn-dependent peptidase
MSNRYPVSRPLPVTITILFLGLALLYAGAGCAQDLASFEKKLTVHVLENGWTFLIFERTVAPVFSFATQVDVGSAQEVPGITGLAHMFEHMAFKGTPVIGTTDYEAEKVAIQELEEAYQAYQRQKQSLNADPEKVEQLLAHFREKQQIAKQFIIDGEFDEIIDREGGVGVNATTSADYTRYYYSLPVNKIELFCYLESERFLHPVFRGFYEERDVVQEERRLRVESSPFGRLYEQLRFAAFASHPYHHPVSGYMSDLQSFTITDAERFYRQHYVPANIVTAVVGDVRATELIPLLEKYFGRIPAGPKPSPLRTVEPPQIAEKTVILKEKAQPVYLEAYHIEAVNSPDQPVYEVIDDILSAGRTSRLYRSLVRDQEVAAQVFSYTSYPGSKYPNLCLVGAIPLRGIGNSVLAEAIRTEIERLKTEDVSDQELAKAKTRARAGLIRSLGSNQGLATQLIEYWTLFGDWREIFHQIRRLEKVTKEDIRRVSQQIFRSSNRTVAMIVTESAEEGSSTSLQSGEE